MSSIKGKGKHPSKHPSGHGLNGHGHGHGKLVSTKAYLPRHGTVPERIFRHLSVGPMPFGELSGLVGRETGMAGDNLASQLSAALRDLVVRGAIVRLDSETGKPISLKAKNQRGVLYGLADDAKKAYEKSGKSGRVPQATPREPVVTSAPIAPEPGQRDLTSFAVSVLPAAAPHGTNGVARPAQMPEALFLELKATARLLRAQLDAVEAALHNPAWSPGAEADVEAGKAAH